MGLILDRPVSRVGDKGETGPPEPLAAYRDTPAYVLLGDPGAGKTTAFRKEVSDSGNSALFVYARDFLTLDTSSHPEWGVHTLFIDGLDEVRAGQSDARTPFDAIRARLDQLRPPAFRISCRDADWLGKNDVTRLESLFPDVAVVVLRLTALNSQEVHKVVSHADGISEPEAFLLKAHDRGLGTLLQNPQTLDLLIKTFGATGQWPTTRQETFERGIEQIAREPNDEHRIGRPEVPQSAILESAGWMSAVHLFSGGARHCLRESDVQPGDVWISAYGEQLRTATDAALRTHLFTDPTPRRFEPAHANIAAFLAARTLAVLLADGLPFRRVLALLAGNGDAPPTSLRGLAAWLAVFSPELRESLIKRDPVAVLMYGDVREFKPDEKALLLEEIAGNPSRPYEGPWPDSALAGLTSADMEPTLRSVLRDEGRSDSKQRVVALVTTALAAGPLGQQLSGVLADVVRDDTRSPDVRRRALDAWIRGFAGDPDRMDRYRELLAQVHEFPGSDPHGGLTATLLDALYPNALSPSGLWDYFPLDPVFPQRLLAEFWQLLAKNCPKDHLASHMDRLADLIPSIRPVLREKLLFDVPLRLLARTLEGCGEEVEPLRLFRWLSVGLDEAGHLQDTGSEAKTMIAQVRQWLEERPDLQKKVIRVALSSDGFRPRSRISTAIRELLYRSEPPDDIGAWHLEQAGLSVSTDRGLMDFHIQEFVENLARHPVRVDEELARARKRLATSPGAVRDLESRLKSELPDDYLDQAEASRRARASDATLLRIVRSQRTPLCENRANPALLHELARLYHAGAFEGEATDRERLLRALSGDEELTEAAIAGIRSAPNREDLPSVERVLQLRSRQELDWLTLPVLVGLTERSVDDVLAFDHDRLATMLALRLARQSSDKDAAWYRECLRLQPTLVADILLRFGRVALAAGEKHLPDLYRLSREPSYSKVAKRVTMPLLRGFPARARTDQHQLLTDLLQSALVHCKRTELHELIERKSGLGSVTRTQRLYWLAAGLALEPNRFGPLLAESGEPDARCQVLERMFPPPGSSVHEVRGLVEKLEPAATKFLIRQLGALRNPLHYEAGVSVGWGWTNSMGVEDHIVRLGRSPDRSATEALQRLAEEPSLGRWKRHLEHALEAQRIIRRNADYTPPAPAAVVAALQNGPPASAADLRELVLDRLKRIAMDVRTTNANVWRHFWTEDKRDNRPKDEDACRDALRGLMLAPSLLEGCDVQPEGQYASNRRSDIRVAFGEWNIPVEIKKNSHRDVWSAVRNQLLPRYTNDPATEGLGIYLVLWFGPERTAGVTKARKPATPEQMRDQLLGKLTSEERRRAAVIVIDVMPP